MNMFEIELEWTTLNNNHDFLRFQMDWKGFKHEHCNEPKMNLNMNCSEYDLNNKLWYWKWNELDGKWVWMTHLHNQT